MAKTNIRRGTLVFIYRDLGEFIQHHKYDMEENWRTVNTGETGKSINMENRMNEETKKELMCLSSKSFDDYKTHLDGWVQRTERFLYMQDAYHAVQIQQQSLMETTTIDENAYHAVQIRNLNRLKQQLNRLNRQNKKKLASLIEENPRRFEKLFSWFGRAAKIEEKTTRRNAAKETQLGCNRWECGCKKSAVRCRHRNTLPSVCESKHGVKYGVEMGHQLPREEIGTWISVAS